MVEGDRLFEEFRAIGKQHTPTSEKYVSKIYSDGRQYYLKISKKLLDKIKYKKGDQLEFTLKLPTKKPLDSLEIKYVRGEENGKQRKTKPKVKSNS